MCTKETVCCANSISILQGSYYKPNVQMKNEIPPLCVHNKSVCLGNNAFSMIEKAAL